MFPEVGEFFIIIIIFRFVVIFALPFSFFSFFFPLFFWLCYIFFPVLAGLWKNPRQLSDFLCESYGLIKSRVVVVLLSYRFLFNK